MMPRRKVFVFDLDDALYKEVDYVKSAFQYIAHRLADSLSDVSDAAIYDTLWSVFMDGGDAFGEVIRQYGVKTYTKADLLDWYRYHKPSLTLDANVRETLNFLKSQGADLAIITDGRQLTQQNKIEALGLTTYMSAVIINDNPRHLKPHKYSYRHMEKQFVPDCEFCYVGDNTSKDFMVPNSLGWRTVCLLDDGRNIHKQSFEEDYCKPQYCVTKMSEILDLL